MIFVLPIQCGSTPFARMIKVYPIDSGSCYIWMCDSRTPIYQLAEGEPFRASPANIGYAQWMRDWANWIHTRAITRQEMIPYNVAGVVVIPHEDVVQGLLEQLQSLFRNESFLQEVESFIRQNSCFIPDIDLQDPNDRSVQYLKSCHRAFLRLWKRYRDEIFKHDLQVEFGERAEYQVFFQGCTKMFAKCLLLTDKSGGPDESNSMWYTSAELDALFPHIFQVFFDEDLLHFQRAMVYRKYNPSTQRPRREPSGDAIIELDDDLLKVLEWQDDWFLATDGGDPAVTIDRNVTSFHDFTMSLATKDGGSLNWHIEGIFDLHPFQMLDDFWMYLVIPTTYKMKLVRRDPNLPNVVYVDVDVDMPWFLPWTSRVWRQTVRIIRTGNALGCSHHSHLAEGELHKFDDNSCIIHSVTRFLEHGDSKCRFQRVERLAPYWFSTIGLALIFTKKICSMQYSHWVHDLHMYDLIQSPYFMQCNFDFTKISYYSTCFQSVSYF